MSELTDKFHDGMTVKLRCGGVLYGVKASGWIHYVCKDETDLDWYGDGTYSEDFVEHPFDIVEVLSEPMLSDAELKAVTVKGWELK
jgi:hypothetical protein